MMPKLQIPRIDTQINIETLNVDIGTLNMDNSKQCSASSDDGLVLGMVSHKMSIITIFGHKH